MPNLKLTSAPRREKGELTACLIYGFSIEK